MPAVEFLVPGSPNGAFLSQIAALRTSILSRPWTRWKPTVRCFLGGPADWPALHRWLPQLTDIDIEILSAPRFEQDGYLAQAERRLSVGTGDIDVVVLLDADTFLVGNIEDALDQVFARNAVGGVMTHFGFPVRAGHSTVEDWHRLGADLLTRPIRLDHEHSLMPPHAPEDTRRCPFYVNAGVILIATSVLADLRTAYTALRPKVVPYLSVPYFAGQVALALAIQELGINTLSLPFRFNFPNDPRADRTYPNELSEAVLIHYLRDNVFNRNRIFADARDYRAFLDLPLKGSNLSFQKAVRSLLGEPYPFASPA